MRVEHRRVGQALALVFSLVFSAAACGPAETPKPPEPAFQQTVPAGLGVLVSRGNQWLPATVVRQTAADRVLVHYDGTPPEWDEDVLFERVRARPGAEPPPAATAEYKVGDYALVTNQNRLFLAEIQQQLSATSFRVHYQGFGPEVVENVETARLKKPFAGTTAFPPGTAVLVFAGGPQPLPGKVLVAITADQWIVRLDGVGPQYDQQVGADRIRPAAPAPTPTVAPTAPPTAPTATVAPTATTAPVVEPPKAAPLKAGDAVLLQVRGLYYPAKVVSPASGGTLKVRVEGQAADEDATESHVMRVPEPQKGRFQPGAAVLVEWHGVFAVGKIIKEADANNYKVRIDGKGESDEIIPTKRLRPKP